MFKWMVFASLVLSVRFVAQTNSSSPLEFHIAPAAGWTDTGLDLQSGDVVKITAEPSISSEKQTDSGLPACSPAGVNNVSKPDLPLPSAPAGALIARLHSQGATAILVGSSSDLKIVEASHLFLGMNTSAKPSCQGGFAVKVEKVSAETANGQTRGAQLKSQLNNAMQLFMSGQFGVGKSETESANNNTSSTLSSGAATAASAPPLSISDRPLDPDLRKHLDSLPRRVNDQSHNLGDMVNFVIVGSQKDVHAALEAASWHVADTDNTAAIFSAVMQTYDKKDYLAMPMSILYLFGRKQDFGYELAEPIAMVASRHHFRIWKADFTWNGQEVWVGAGTHDIGFAKDKRNNSVTHKIDPAVDGERDNIGSTLQKANKAKTLTYYLPPDPVKDARNATGDSYHSDGRMLVIFLQ